MVPRTSLQIFGTAAAVDVVTEHDHEVERIDHSLSHFILRRLAGSHVADDREAD
jgi:hypothetical protein